jgi:hypothetical protein
MNATPLQANLLAAWLGILLGFLSGMGLGLFFHRDDWLGGYGSFKRRLYRLGHISLFALGLANLCFYFTAREFSGPALGLAIASWAFILGAVAMPLCCLVTAHFPAGRLCFGVPVLSLVLGGALTILAIVGSERREEPLISRSPSAPLAVGVR